MHRQFCHAFDGDALVVDQYMAFRRGVQEASEIETVAFAHGAGGSRIDIPVFPPALLERFRIAHGVDGEADVAGLRVDDEGIFSALDAQIREFEQHALLLRLLLAGHEVDEGLHIDEADRRDARTGYGDHAHGFRRGDLADELPDHEVLRVVLAGVRGKAALSLHYSLSFFGLAPG